MSGGRFFHEWFSALKRGDEAVIRRGCLRFEGYREEDFMAKCDLVYGEAYRAVGLVEAAREYLLAEGEERADAAEELRRLISDFEDY